MSSAATSLPTLSISVLTAGLLALGVACSGASGRGGLGDTHDLSSSTSGDSAGATPSSSALATQPAAVPSEPVPHDAHASRATARDRAEARPAATALAAQKSPIHALNQMVTAQALLVSLLLAPLSKEGSEVPLARVDVAPASAPAH